MKQEKTSGRKLTLSYTAIQCCYNMGYSCVICFASVFLISRGFTNSQVGITLTLANALAIVCQPTLASFADKAQKVPLRAIVAGVILFSGIITLLLMVVPALLIPTAVLYILLLCAMVMQPALVTSLCMEHVNQGVSLNFSLARGFGSFAFAVLALILGSLTDSVGAWIVLPIGLFVCLISTSLVITFPKPAEGVSGGGISPKKKEQEEKPLSFLAFTKKYRRFMLSVLSIVLLFFSHVLINSYTIQIIEHVGGSATEMGMASAIGGFLELPAMAIFPFLLRKVGSAGVILKVSAVFLVIKTLVTLLAPDVFWIYVAQCLQFFAFALYVPASVYYANRIITGKDKVKGQAFIGMAAAISGMIGNVSGGFMLDMGGVPFMLTVGLCVSVVGLLLLLFLAPRDKEQEEQPVLTEKG